MENRGEHNKTRLSYWFPLIQAAGLPVPRTEIVSLDDRRHESLIIDCCGEGDGSGLTTLASEIKSRSEIVGVPFFLRTDFTSAKHDWDRTCCVRDLTRIMHHIINIAEYSEMVDFIGLPIDVWVVRELLNTQPAFHAFRNMPITKEFRFFVRDGEIEHMQPYWIPDSIRQPSIGNWQEPLKAISTLDAGERESLTDLTHRASAAVPGYWSVDWLMTTDRGWVLTDMAEGEHSFKWDADSVCLSL